MSLGERARNTLLKCGQIIADHYGYALSTVGERGGGDHRFFAHLADRGNFTLDKYDEVACWLRGHWPHGYGIAWPTMGTLGPPEPSEVRAFMAKLPKKRLLTKPRKRGQRTDSPALNASRLAKTAPTHSALPPFVEGVGELLGKGTPGVRGG